MKQLLAILITTSALLVNAQTKGSAPAAVTTASPSSRSTTSEVKQQSVNTSKALFEYTSFTGYVSKEGKIELKSNDYEAMKEDMVVNLKKRIGETSDQSEQNMMLKQYEKMQNGELTVEENLNLLGVLGYELVSTSTYTVEDRTFVQFFLKRQLKAK